MSASRMIDDIIKSFLALPKLELSPEVSAEFKMLTNHLVRTAKLITLENFKTLWSQHKSSCITLNEMEVIEKYLKAWELMMVELDKFIPLMQAGWYTAYGKPIGGDETLPFLINLIPSDDVIISKLYDILDNASDVDQSNYHINAFATAAHYHLNNKDFVRDALDEKCRILIRDLRLDNGLTLLQIAAILNNICVQKMNEYYRDLYKGFEIHFINEAGEKVEKVDKPEMLEDAIPKIVQMYAKVGEHPFTSYPELGKDVKKFISYYEILQSLHRIKNNNVFERLRECSYKFPIHEAALDDDLDTVKTPVNNATQTYFGIPDDKRISVFNLLWAPPKPELPLRKLMEYLARKILQVETSYELEKHAAANAAPPAVNF